MATAPTHIPEARRPRQGSRRFGVLGALAPFLKPHRVLIAAGLAVLLVTTVVSLLLPLIVGRLVDRFSAGAFDNLNWYFVLGMMGVTALAVGSALRLYLVARLGEHVVVDLRNAVFGRVITMGPAFYEGIMTGEVLSRITTDTILVQNVLGASAANALRNALLLCGGVFLLVTTSIKLAALVLLVVPVTLLPILLLGRQMRIASRAAHDWIAASSGKASESLSAVQTVQSFTNEEAIQSQFQHFTTQSFKAGLRRTEIRALLTLAVIFLSFTACLGVLWLGIQDVQAGVMSLGTLVQFMIYALMVANALNGSAALWGDLQRAAGATERLVELLEAQDDVADPALPLPLPPTVQGHIVFKGVQFHYPTRPDALALNSIDLEIAPGETVALVGPSGAGKSTLVHLVQRFYDPTAGDITLDGHNLRDLARSKFRRHIATVPQDPAIFAASALDNIRFGRLDATQHEVEAAARAADAHDFIVRFPQGYDSQLGERGVKLSGGQKQRIAIARAILRDAPILLLDEATSALDAESEAAVQRAVERLSRDRTTIIIAHRLATVKKADRIVVLNEGAVVASGSHDELVAAGGLYARLAKLQFIG